MSNIRLLKNSLGLVLLVLFLAQAVGAAGSSAVNLGTAGNYAVLSKARISTIEASSGIEAQ